MPPKKTKTRTKAAGKEPDTCCRELHADEAVPDRELPQADGGVEKAQ